MLKITECGIDYEIVYSDDNVRNVMLRHIEQLQAQIDALMLEHCPDEMSPEQVAIWGSHQKSVPNLSGEPTTDKEK